MPRGDPTKKGVQEYEDPSSFKYAIYPNTYFSNNLVAMCARKASVKENSFCKENSFVSWSAQGASPETANCLYASPENRNRQASHGLQEVRFGGFRIGGRQALARDWAVHTSIAFAVIQLTASDLQEVRFGGLRVGGG